MPKRNQRFIDAIGVINPRARKASDPGDSNLMSADDMQRAVHYLREKPMKFYHGSQIKDASDSAAFSLGQVKECFVNNGRLLCYFRINRDEDNPIEYFTGTQVLSGLLNGLSASTRALRNKETGEIISNCADPAHLKAIGSANTDPGLEVSLCSRDDAARGTDCEILYATEWEKLEDGRVQHLGNVFQPDQARLTELLSSDADIYKHCAEQAIGEKSSSFISSGGHSTFEPLVVQACKERKMSNPSSTPTDSAAAPPTTTPSTGEDANNRKRTGEAVTEPSVVDKSTESDAGNAKKRQANEEAAGGGGTDQAEDTDASKDMTALLRRLEELEKANREHQEEKKRIEAEKKQAHLQTQKEVISKMTSDFLADYGKMLEEQGKKPEEDKYFMALKSVDKVNSEEQLGPLRNAAEMIQTCTLSWRRAVNEVAKMSQTQELQKRREERNREIEEKRRKIASIQANNDRAASSPSSSSSSSVAGVYTDPYEALSKLGSAPPSSLSLDGMTKVPSSASSMQVDEANASAPTTGAADGGGGGAHEDPRMAFFEQTPSGSWVLKPPAFVAPQYSTERIIATTTTPAISTKLPSDLAMNVPEYSGALPNQFVHGMQGYNPQLYMDIVQECVRSGPSGVPERVPANMLVAFRTPQKA